MVDNLASLYELKAQFLLGVITKELYNSPVNELIENSKDEQEKKIIIKYKNLDN